MKGLNGQEFYLNINEGLVSIYLFPHTIAFTIPSPFSRFQYQPVGQSHSQLLQLLSTYHIE